MFKSRNAITLIALIITIIVLLILAAVTINMVLGENGLINKAKTSVAKYENAQEKENIALSNYEALIDSINSSRDIDTATLKSLIKEVIKEEKIDTTPIGTIIAFSVNSVPSSEYLVCNGQSVSKTEYSDLYALLGETYGAGDNSNEFKVPDLRGEFLRGAGTNGHTDQGNGANVGAHQNATVQPGIRITAYSNMNETHIVFPRPKKPESDGASIQPENVDKSFGSRLQNGIFDYQSNFLRYDLGLVESSEFYASRPTNTSVLYCIKAK